MRRRESVLQTTKVMLAIGLALAGGEAKSQPQPGYYDIPAGFDFPASKQLLEQYRTSGNLSAQRLHVWNVYAGMTRPTPDGKYAIFETWYPLKETFQTGASPQANVPRRVVRELERPAQFEPMPGQPGLQAAGSGLFATVMFNYAAHNHIRSNKLHLRSTLMSLQQTGATDPKIPSNRTIPAFPAEAVSLKTIWIAVKRTGLTAVPVWDPEFNPVLPNGNPPETWKRVVAVDPSRQVVPKGETTNISFAGTPFANASVVGIGSFHYYQLDQQSAAAAQANGFNVDVGDFIIFVGTHLTTKEIDDWVWATFWWHDRPTVGQFANDRPASVQGVWRNYLMSSAYDLELPKEGDGRPLINFNPWLEAGFQSGTVSNCMNCHNRASWRPTSFLPVFRGQPNVASDPAFRPGQLRTDLLWSVPREAKP